MTLGQRILHFIDVCYGTQKRFAEETGIGAIQLNRYINDKTSPGIEALIRFKDSGMSIDWLVEGEGSMFANNHKGRALQVQQGNLQRGDKVTPYDRIRIWITEHFETLENYTVCLNADFNELYNVLFNGMISDPSMLQDLKKAGCNISWLSTGSGSKYADNMAGLILKAKFEGIAPTSEEGKMLREKIFHYFESQPSNSVINIMKDFLKNENKNEGEES